MSELTAEEYEILKLAKNQDTEAMSSNLIDIAKSLNKRGYIKLDENADIPYEGSLIYNITAKGMKAKKDYEHKSNYEDEYWELRDTGKSEHFARQRG